MASGEVVAQYLAVCCLRRHSGAASHFLIGACFKNAGGGTGALVSGRILLDKQGVL
jgi:hypothetical protein